MALIVQKYGGTSVGTVERIQAVAEKVAGFHKRGDQVVVVVSAMSGETNRLIELAKGVSDNPSPREMDVLVSTGEQVTIALLSMALQKLGINARSYTGSGQRHGGGVGTTTAEGGNVAVRINTLETGHDHHTAAIQIGAHFLVVNLFDTGLGVDTVGAQGNLATRVGAGYFFDN